MSRAVLMSLHSQWFMQIVLGIKIFEIRKRAPAMEHPYKVYLYCTKNSKETWFVGIKGRRESYLMNGTVCAEFVCDGTIDYEPERLFERGTCLSLKSLVEYSGGKKLSYMRIRDPIMYDKPKGLEDFGLKKAPQSWCYIEDGS